MLFFYEPFFEWVIGRLRPKGGHRLAPQNTLRYQTKSCKLYEINFELYALHNACYKQNFTPALNSSGNNRPPGAALVKETEYLQGFTTNAYVYTAYFI